MRDGWKWLILMTGVLSLGSLGVVVLALMDIFAEYHCPAALEAAQTLSKTPLDVRVLGCSLEWSAVVVALGVMFLFHVLLVVYTIRKVLRQERVTAERKG